MYHRQERRVHALSDGQYKYDIFNEEEKSANTCSAPTFVLILCMETRIYLLNSNRHQTNMLELFYRPLSPMSNELNWSSAPV
jgi:hypothetical protein